MPQFPRVGDDFGRYRIDAQIGQGGMGVVFLATDTEFDRRVALKVVSAALGGSAEFLARFEREAALLARLNSPHVIAIFDYGEQDGCPYLATQYVGGGDLGALLAARGPMPPKLAAEVCAQVADALSDAHRAGVVHRDVKPTNVLLRDADTLDLHAYLCDFGIARTDSEGLTAPGSVSGTWSYLAPECGTGAPGTVASDLYALGCLLWAALTGQAPFRGTDVEIAIAHQRAPVPQLAGDDPFTRHVNAILANTLAKDPRARYADADTLRTDLLAAAAIPSTGVRPVPAAAPAPPTAPPGAGGPSPRGPISLGSLPPGSPLPAPRRRRTALVVAATCLAVLAVAGGIVAVTLAGDDPNDPTGGATASPTTGSPSGSETGGPTEPPAPPEVVGPVTGDVDGDGLGDVTVYEYVEAPGQGGKGQGDKGTYELMTWSSTGTAFGSPSTDTSQSAKRLDRSHSLADIDGDDLLDLVAARSEKVGDPLSVSVALGSGGTVTAEVPRVKGGQYVAEYVGDADADGLDDLVLVAYDKFRMRVWVARSTGSGFEDPRPALDLDTGYQESEVEVGDFDGDGRVDVAVLTTPGDQEPRDFTVYKATLRVYLGQEGLKLAADGSPRDVDTTIANAFVAGDFDGDEASELALVEDRSSFVQLSVFDYAKGSGTKRPKPWGLFPEPANTFFDSTVVPGDFDGDGRDDLVLVGPSARPKVADLQVVLSSGKRFGSASRWATWRRDLKGSYGVRAIGDTFP